MTTRVRSSLFVLKAMGTRARFSAVDKRGTLCDFLNDDKAFQTGPR